MIGLIKLTSVDNQAFFINPIQITMFTESTPEFCGALCGNPNSCVKGATTMLVGSLPLQLKDTPKDIISALIRLRDQQHQVAINLMKDRSKEDWQREDDDEENEDCYGS